MSRPCCCGSLFLWLLSIVVSATKFESLVKIPGSQKGSPAAAEEGAKGRGGGRGEGGERR